MIDSANAPIFGVDIDGRINIWYISKSDQRVSFSSNMYRNKKAAEIMQYTSNDVTGKDLVEDFITPEYRDSVQRVLQLALEGKESSNFGTAGSEW